MKRLLAMVVPFSLLCASDVQDINNLYIDKNYEQAYLKLKDFLKRNPTSIKANLLLANCAYNLSNYDKAMAAYDRVLILDEGNNYAKIQEAKIYLRNHNTYMAKLELDNLLKSKSLSKKQRQTVENLKNKIFEEKKKVKQLRAKSFRTTFSVGLMYSSNASDASGEKIIDVSGLPITIGENKEGETSAFTSLNLTYDKSLSEVSGIATSFYGNLSKYKHGHNVGDDLTYLMASISPYYSIEDIKILFPFSYSKVFLDNSSYVDTYSLGLEVLKDIKNGQIDTGYKFSVNKYYGENKEKDSYHYDLYLGLQKILTSDTLGYAYLRYAKNSKKDVSSVDVNVDYSSYGIDLGLNKEIYKKLMAKFGLYYKNYSYKDFNSRPIIESKRKDKIYSYLIGLNYNIDNKSYVDIDLNYVDKKSNQFLYEYDNMILSSSYSYKF